MPRIDANIRHRGIAELNDYFKGEPIWIVCTGTSLRGFPWEALDDEITIACNDAVFFLKEPTVHIFNDQKVAARVSDTNVWRGQGPWMNRMIARPEGWRYADGQVVATRLRCLRRLWAEPAGKRVQLYRWEKADSCKLKMKHSTLFCRSTVAVSAFQLAVRMGAAWIGLLGADCYMRGTARYWWEPFRDGDKPSHQGQDGGRGDYGLDWREAKAWRDEVAPNVQVVNYSPQSPLIDWPKSDWRLVFPPKDKEVTDARRLHIDRDRDGAHLCASGA